MKARWCLFIYLLSGFFRLMFILLCFVYFSLLVYFVRRVSCVVSLRLGVEIVLDVGFVFLGSCLQ